MSQPDEAVVRAAWLYYMEDRNQQQIAEVLSVSRPTVSRLLARARDTGVVEIRMRAQLPEATKLERELLASFSDLVAANVAPASPQGQRVAVGAAAAVVIDEMVAGRYKNLAVGWGRTVGELAIRLRPEAVPDLTIIDAVGYAPAVPGPTSIEVTRIIATRLSANAVHLPAPAVVRPKSAARSIVKNDQVKRALRLAREAAAAVVSVGAVSPDSPLQGEGLLTANEWRKLTDAGAVGDVLGHFLDSDGAEIVPAESTWIGLSLADLRAKDRVVGLVAGPDKAAVTAVAIRAGILNHLVIDEAAAGELIEFAAAGR
ncbi:MAG: sugar-binding transcriptional regulator [Arachnia sp.]